MPAPEFEVPKKNGLILAKNTHTNSNGNASLLTGGTASEIDTYSPAGKQNSGKRIPDKVFVERESLLTSMFKVKEFRGLYNIFLVILLNMALHTILVDYLEHGKFELGWSNLRSTFGKPVKTLLLLVSLHVTAILVYFPIRFWIFSRRSRDLHKGWRLVIDFLFAAGTLGISGLFIYIPIKLHWADPLPPASGTIIVMEQVRLFMKMYAFLRTKAPFAFTCTKSKPIQASNPLSEGSVTSANGLRQRGSAASKENDVFESKSASSSEIHIEFSSYLYYLYAPTLIYRDSYPRTKEIRWAFVIRNTIELFGCIFVYNLLHNLCGFVRFENFGLPGHKMSARQVLDSLFFQMVPGGVGFLLGFFVLLHTSQNIFAEILRFGDRQFYKDWWNSNTFSCFYRNWNLPVHGFLYTYIYKETKELGFRSKFVPAISVFFVSAVVHEYILAFVLQFFYPVLLVFFGGFGVVLNFIQTPRFGGNTFIWWSLIVGKGLILFFYSIEYFARQNGCPAAESVILDFFIPRSWTCDAFTWNGTLQN